MADEPRNRHPSGLFDTAARAAFTAAQSDAERRGGKVLVSGLILYAAVKAGNDSAARLLNALGTDLDSLSKAVDDEWNARSAWMQDQPFTLLNEAFQAVAAESEPGTELHMTSLLVKLLGYPDSMASRLVRRVGGEPSVAAERIMRS
jgi:ATP-dependent Clp protease ATP-binding subunit ClpA